MSASLEEFVAAGPWPLRAVMRALIPVVRRPRGRSLLARFAGADQALSAVDAVGRYDEPRLARALGWDADAVVARGRALRHDEGRP